MNTLGEVAPWFEEGYLAEAVLLTGVSTGAELFLS